MITDVFRLLNGYIEKGDCVVAGISGGPDSTALLDLLVSFSVQKPCKIIVAHVNHGIRGAAANKDENFVKKMAKKYNLKFEVKRVKLAGKMRLEELGRKIRRDFFEKLREKYKAKWIITAHTQDDQVETIIFNFLRGSGPRGLGGMEFASGAYLKPLLGVFKTQVLAYLKSKKLAYCVDNTNSDESLSRNFIRRKLIPLAEKLNPSVKQTLIRNAPIFKEIDGWLQREAESFLKKQRDVVAKSRNSRAVFAARDFLKLPEALQQAVIQASYQRCAKYTYQLPITKVDEILRLIKRNIGKKKIITGKPAVEFLLEKGVVEVKSGTPL